MGSQRCGDRSGIPTATNSLSETYLTTWIRVSSRNSLNVCDASIIFRLEQILICRSAPPALTCLLISLTEFGTVLELRINSGGKLPNFGFVVFDDAEPVQKILSSRVCVAVRHCAVQDVLTNAGS